MTDRLYRVLDLTPEASGDFWESVMFHSSAYAIVDSPAARPIVRAEDAERKVRLAEAHLAQLDIDSSYFQRWAEEDAKLSENTAWFPKPEDRKVYAERAVRNQETAAALRAIEEADDEWRERLRKQAAGCRELGAILDGIEKADAREEAMKIEVANLQLSNEQLEPWVDK